MKRLKLETSLEYDALKWFLIVIDNNTKFKKNNTKSRKNSKLKENNTKLKKIMLSRKIILS